MLAVVIIPNIMALEKLIDSLYLKGAIKECAEKLAEYQENYAFSTSCGSLVINENEEIQVQVIVTRKKEDFLGDFDVVAFSMYNG